MPMKWLLVAALACIVIGCNSGNEKSFQVEARNESGRAVTLWLTKDGPPAEEGWLTPEQVVDASQTMKYDLAFVPAGRVGYTAKMSGIFPPGTRAVLRVYEGEKEVFDLAKAAPSSRADYVLKSGSNRLRIVDRSGQLAVEPQ
jgi:hypothetical protein